MWTFCSKYASSSTNASAIGLPFLIALPEDVDIQTLYDAVRARCSRFISDEAEASHFKNAGLCLFDSNHNAFSF